jgi:flagella basal body P-ring formation protein FlgA
MRAILGLFFLTQAAMADIVVPNRTIRPNTVLTADILILIKGNRIDSFDRIEDVVGQEARVALYAGRPILFDSIGPPALVDRNEIVTLRYESGGLVISTAGRVLQRGGAGDRVRVMNLASRATLFGFVQTDGSISVYP